MLKWLLFALVIAFVGWRAWQLWRDGDVGSVTIHWPWLLAAGGFYLVGWLPSLLFWQKLIHGLGGTSRQIDIGRSFFCGHLGKYVPGKGSVLLIRAGMLQDKGCRPAVAALTSTYETLVCMGVGAAVGLTLAPVVWPHSFVDRLPGMLRAALQHPLTFGLGVVTVCVALVPIVAGLLGAIARKLTPLTCGEETDTTPPYRVGRTFLLAWCFLFVLTWLAHGLSLGCTLRAVGVATPLSDWLTWTGDVSSASFLGFVAVFAPGGLGVREAVLIGLLEHQVGISQSQAVAATVLLRGVWLAAEIVATVGLSWGVKRTKSLQIAK